MKRLVVILLLVSVSLAWGLGKSYKGSKTITNTVTISGGRSAVTATFAGHSMANYATALVRLIVEPSPNSKRGYGLSDSAYLHVYTTFLNEKMAIGTDSANVLPCTLNVLAVNTDDTLWKGDIICDFVLTDTTSDTAMQASHRIMWEILTRE